MEHSELKKIVVKCLKCGDVLHSKHEHDAQKCSCGNVKISGGPYKPIIIGSRATLEVTEMKTVDLDRY